MLNVQPENIVRDIVFIETEIDIMYIFLVVVVPPTLVIAQCKSLIRKRTYIYILKELDHNDCNT